MLEAKRRTPNEFEQFQTVYKIITPDILDGVADPDPDPSLR